jgi:hypothetical protein
VVHTCNPSIRKADEEGQEFKASLDYIERPCLKKERARQWWLTAVILATQEAEIRRIAV